VRGKQVDYSVRIDLPECPVSFIEDGVPELVNILDRTVRMHSTFGAPIFDRPLAQWPGKWVEALEVLERCRVEEHNARVTAETREAHRK